MKRAEREAWEREIERRRAGAPIRVTTPTEFVQALNQVVAERGRHGNLPTVVNGERFHSKLEADRFRELLLLQATREVAFFLRQVPFHLAPGVVWRADFLIVWNRSGSWGDVVTVEDTKGHLTDTARVKIRTCEKYYGITVRILKRADVRRGS